MPLPDSAHDVLDAFEERLASGEFSFRRANKLDELTERRTGPNGTTSETLRFPPSVVCRLLRRGEAVVAGNKLTLLPAGWQAARNDYDQRKPPRGQQGNAAGAALRSK